jgi:hypothetical protein
MQKRMFGMTTVAVCVWALSLLTAPGAHAQGQQAKVIAQAKGDTDPFVMVLTDSAKGVAYDENATKSMTAALAGTDWSVLDNGQLVISKGQDVLLGSSYMSNQGLTLFLLHEHSAKSIVDGWIWRSTSDPRQGVADLFITIFDKDGAGSFTIVYEGNLTFAASSVKR